MSEEPTPEPVSMKDALASRLQKMQEMADSMSAEQENQPRQEIDATPALIKGGFPSRHVGEVCQQGPGAEVAESLWTKVSTGDCLIILCGARGTGKTQMATEWARRRVKSGQSAGRYAKCYDLIAEIKSTWHDGGRAIGTEQDVLKKYRTAKYLVIDEWNERGASAWEAATLTNILDHRYDNGLATVLICNSPADKLHDHIDASILDRAAETGGIKPCEWVSYRQ
jgi:Cdc6-like AAA superfamily ATPase